MDDNANKDQAVTITAPPAQQVTIDPQNPLPEPSFMWRRVLTMVVSFALLGIAWHNAIQLHDLGISADLLTFAKWCIALNGFVLLCYFVGPSAAEIVSMIQSAKIINRSLDMAKSADDNATRGPETPQNRAGTGQGERFGGSVAADSQIPEPAPGEAPGRPDGPSGNSEEIDAAPRGRQP